MDAIDSKGVDAMQVEIRAFLCNQEKPTSKILRDLEAKTLRTQCKTSILGYCAPPNPILLTVPFPEPDTWLIWLIDEGLWVSTVVDFC